MPDNDLDVERRKHQLTDDEMTRLRKIIKKDENMEWLGAAARNSAVWVVAVITGVTLGYNALADTLKHLVGK